MTTLKETLSAQFETLTFKSKSGATFGPDRHTNRVTVNIGARTSSGMDRIEMVSDVEVTLYGDYSYRDDTNHCRVTVRYWFRSGTVTSWVEARRWVNNKWDRYPQKGMDDIANQVTTALLGLVLGQRAAFEQLAREALDQDYEVEISRLRYDVGRAQEKLDAALAKGPKVVAIYPYNNEED